MARKRLTPDQAMLVYASTGQIDEVALVVASAAAIVAERKRAAGRPPESVSVRPKPTRRRADSSASVAAQVSGDVEM